jgi:hypothetical protein
MVRKSRLINFDRNLLHSSATYGSDLEIAKLGWAMEGLLQLTQSTAALVDWWLTMDTALAMLETSVASLQPQKVLKLKVGSIRKRWEKVSIDYQDYKLKVGIPYQCPSCSSLQAQTPCR